MTPVPVEAAPRETTDAAPSVPAVGDEAVEAPARTEQAPAVDPPGSLEKFASSIGVWLLYVPHYAVLKALPPRYGLAWARLIARVHWLFTFLGEQRTARANFASLSKLFESKESVSTILRKHLEMKHECFARVRVYHQHGVDSGDLTWTVPESHAAALEAAQSHDGGLLVVGFHHNFFEMTAPAFAQLMPDREVVQVKLRQAHNLDKAAACVADVATTRAIEADRRSGAPIFYIDGEESLRPLLRMLRSGKAVGVAADGGYSSDFIDAPFLDGTLRVSTGWAKLAAMTKAHLLLIIDQPERGSRRFVYMHDHLQCRDNSDESIHGVVCGAVRILEEAIMREPWGWHPWQRLRGERDADGVLRYELTSARAAETNRPAKVATQSGTRASADNGRPRVAILCNSVTPYRLHLHRRIVDEVPEAELWTLSTHGNAYSRWSGTTAPEEIRPVDFGNGEPTNEQTMVRHSAREWRKGGEVIKWLRENRAEAVFCQGCGDIGRLRVLRWCHKNGVPAYLTGDFNTRGVPVAWWKRPLKRMIYKPAVAWSRGLMPCGRLGLDLLHGFGGRGKPSYWFPFLPDTTLQSDPPAEAVDGVRERFGFDAERKRIVFSARMMPVKRPDLAIEAFAKIADERPDWDLVMVGDGVLREPSEALVPESLKNRVIWTGFFDRPDDVAAVYNLSNVLLLPSDHEPWGVVIVEAAAAGLAIVTTDVVGAAPELLHPGRNGETFPAGDADAMADALLRVTAPDRIGAMQAESPKVLREWLDYADPVDGFRSALRDCGLIADAASGADRHAG